MVCFVWTPGAEDVGVELHDAADACTLVMSLSATWFLLMLALRVFTYNRPMMKMKETLIFLRCEIFCRRTCVIGRISSIKSATVLMVPEVMKKALKLTHWPISVGVHNLLLGTHGQITIKRLVK